MKNIHACNFSSSFGNWGLFLAIIHKIINIVEYYDFKLDDISKRFFPINFAKIPIINEFLTWHVEFALHKGGGVR